MAAIKVFSIPEILEDILLRVAYQAKKHEAENCGTVFMQHTGKLLELGDPFRLEPTARLSIIRAVSRDFRDTIRRSPKLQRALTGSLETSVALVNTPPSLPMKWLFQRVLGKMQVRNQPCVDLTIQHQMGVFRDRLDTFLGQGGRQREGIWRQVKIHQKPTTAFFEIWIAPRMPRTYMGGCSYTENINMSICTTLGEFLDILFDVLNRSTSEHVARHHALSMQGWKDWVIDYR
ncbi:uncharacterized protein RCC_07284 [Ramularia collo-cygni]|uniref:Uncharacterized protein n=1 Tax=Ramularia collo-cygni TaxID=112498 RepID=A0A2D3UX76_9PEZI|nr:uncharacterized protein RCC_07284 [Ramularia collo-cygni]CZT21421.1 uncharacterized protein RCC_07284 [Ramularia collo-cygni]